MDDQAIQKIIDLLEAEPSFGTSRVISGKPDYYVFLTANRAGLLKLASVLLRASIEPILADDCRSKPLAPPGEFTQIYEDEKDLVLGFVQRMETWPEPAINVEERKFRNWKRDRLALLTCGIIASILGLIFIAGIAAIWSVVIR
jgi:hypothetical protein